MKKDKDLYDLFRESEPQLRKQPPKRAWRKLEQRLDARHQSGRTIWYRQLAMVATLLALVAFISLLTVVLIPSQGDSMASNEARPQYLEDVTGVDPDPTTAQMLALRDEYPEVKLVEGDKDREIRVVHAALRESEPPATTLAMKHSQRINRAPEDRELRKEKEEEGPMIDGIATGADPAFADDQTVEVYHLPEKSVDIDAVALEEISSPEAKKAAGAAERSAAPIPQAQEEDFADLEEAVQLNASRNSIAYYPETMDPTILQFQWLIGQWKTQTPQGTSLEEWSAVDRFTIEGKGFLVINGKKTMTEKMEIRKVGEDLYFITALEEGGQQQRFRLQSYQSGQAVFANDSITEFPQQIILQQNTPDNFSTILQNESYSNISGKQLQYLQQRNVISNEQAVRNLSRVQ